MCFSLTGHKYHHCCPPPPLNGTAECPAQPGQPPGKQMGRNVAVQAKILLVASGKAWTAVLQDKQQCWSEFHRRARFPIHNIIQFLTHKTKQGTVYTVDSWNMEDPDKKGRPPHDVQPVPGGSFIPSTAGLATPLHENKRRILNPRSESIASRYVRFFPTPNIRFASTGKAVRPNTANSHPTRPHGEFAIPAFFKRNPVFQFSNQDRLESQPFPGHARRFD